MPEIMTGPDSIRVYLTGAASDGAAQASPNLSLGNYRSSTRVASLGILVTGGPANVTVNYASGANGIGSSSLSSESTTSLAWTPVGGAKGAAVTIANGETKILMGGGAPQKYIEVSRTSAANLAGTATVTLTYPFDNVYDNVSEAEDASGDTEYRCLCLKNVSASEVKNIKLFLDLLGTARAVNAAGYAASGAVTVTIKAENLDDWSEYGPVFENDTTGEVLQADECDSSALDVHAVGRDVWGDAIAAGTEDDVLSPIPPVRLALEAPSAQPDGHATDKTGAGEGSQPAGLTWKHPHSAVDADVLTIASLAAGEIWFLWIEWRVIVAAPNDPASLVVPDFSFESV